MTMEAEQPTPTNAPLNADIEMFLHSAGALEIDFWFGMAELGKYLQDLQQLKAGLKFKDLGISQRRESCLPKLLLTNEAQSGTFSFADKWAIQDQTGTPPGSIALLKLQGVMRSQSGISNSGADQFSDYLRAAYANKNISGVIIETNSGGGESMAGTMIKSAIQERNKPVIGFAHLAASAAYRALSGADAIMASGDSAEFGSIGTMISLDKKMLEEYRSRFADFYGTGAPKKNFDFRGAVLENFEGIQTRVDSLTESFHREIEKDRQLQGGPDMVRETLNGSVYNAVESKQRGLIDMIGNLQTAARRVHALRSQY